MYYGLISKYLKILRWPSATGSNQQDIKNDTSFSDYCNSEAMSNYTMFDGTDQAPRNPSYFTCDTVNVMLLTVTCHLL